MVNHVEIDCIQQVEKPELNRIKEVGAVTFTKRPWWTITEEPIHVDHGAQAIADPPLEDPRPCCQTESPVYKALTKRGEGVPEREETDAFEPGSSEQEMPECISIVPIR